MLSLLKLQILAAVVVMLNLERIRPILDLPDLILQIPSEIVGICNILSAPVILLCLSLSQQLLILELPVILNVFDSLVDLIFGEELAKVLKPFLDAEVGVGIFAYWLVLMSNSEVSHASQALSFLRLDQALDFGKLIDGGWREHLVISHR